MMRKPTLWRAVTAVVIVVLLIAGGVALYRFGLGRGYALAAGAEGVEFDREMWGSYHHVAFPFGRHPMGFFPFGSLLGLFLTGLLFLFVVKGIFRLIFFRPWPMHPDADPEAWSRWHGPGWGAPPWQRAAKDPPETQDPDSEISPKA